MTFHADNMSVDMGFDALDYGYAPPPGTKRDVTVYGERNLWCAVIAQAFMDMGAITMISAGRKPGAICSRGKAFDDAARWLLRDTASFLLICDLAGVSPFIIRKAAQLFYGRTQIGATLPVPNGAAREFWNSKL